MSLLDNNQLKTVTIVHSYNIIRYQIFSKVGLLYEKALSEASYEFKIKYNPNNQPNK